MEGGGGWGAKGELKQTFGLTSNAVSVPSVRVIN